MTRAVRDRLTAVWARKRATIERICLALVIVFPILGGCVASPDDSMSRAKEANQERSLPMSDDAADFVVEMMDARRMDSAEGRLAMNRGTTETISDYGQRMVTDQAVLTVELTRIAEEAGVALATTLSEEKSAVLENLSTLRGEAFDEEFVETITLDHERDLEAFAEAREMEYGPVREFAVAYRPMIERHMALIRDIAERRASGGQAPLR